MSLLNEWANMIRPQPRRGSVAGLLASRDPVENARMNMPAEPARYGATLTSRTPDAVDGVRPTFGLPGEPLVTPERNRRDSIMAEMLTGASGGIGGVCRVPRSRHPRRSLPRRRQSRRWPRFKQLRHVQRRPDRNHPQIRDCRPGDGLRRCKHPLRRHARNRAMTPIEYPKSLYLRGWDDLGATVTVHNAPEEADARAVGYRTVSEPVDAPAMDDDAPDAPKRRGRLPGAVAAASAE